MRTWDRLSATFVRGVKKPGKHYDGGGLVLQVTPTKTKGVVTKSWLFRYESDQRERYMGLGSARVISLSEARELANEARSLLARRIDPLSQRNADRMAARAAELHTKTFKECLDQLLASHGDKWGAKHLEQWRVSMATYCGALMPVAVADIDVGMVLRCIEGEWKRVPITMDRVRQRIGEVLAWAQARGFRQPEPLPTRWDGHLDKLLPRPREVKKLKHHAAMGYEAVPGLYQRLIASDAVPELCLAFLLLTATRSQEARGARWDEIDLAEGLWIIPAERMKADREHRVPLSPQAVKLIGRLARNGDLLFTVNGSAKPIHALTLRKALHRHGGGSVTVHGFRSAFRTWGGERTAAPRELLEVALAHSVGNATEQAYARGDLLEKRRKIMTQWATHCASPPAPAGAKVVALKRA